MSVIINFLRIIKPKEHTACFQVPGSEATDVSLREEEILALIQKQNHDCSASLVAKGSGAGRWWEL